jgi:maleylacetate reductase
LQDFVYQTSPMLVVFGTGTVTLVADEVARLGIKRALVFSTPPQRVQAERIAQLLGPFLAGVFSRAVVHTPISVTEEAMKAMRDLNADGIVAVGGGATTGIGKAVALRSGLLQVVLPTTYAGSEMTPILGETHNGIKTTQSSSAVLPETVIYDVDLTLSMPPRLSALSGLNAMAHAVEALYARDRNPVVSLMAGEAITKLAQALPDVCARPDEKSSRFNAFMARGYAEFAWATSAWRSTTNSVTPWVGCSTCHTPRPMRYCCRTQSPTTRRPRRMQWRSYRGH